MAEIFLEYSECKAASKVKCSFPCLVFHAIRSESSIHYKMSSPRCNCSQKYSWLRPFHVAWFCTVGTSFISSIEQRGQRHCLIESPPSAAAHLFSYNVPLKTTKTHRTTPREVCLSWNWASATKPIPCKPAAARAVLSVSLPRPVGCLRCRDSCSLVTSD